MYTYVRTTCRTQSASVERDKHIWYGMWTSCPRTMPKLKDLHFVSPGALFLLQAWFDPFLLRFANNVGIGLSAFMTRSSWTHNRATNSRRKRLVYQYVSVFEHFFLRGGRSTSLTFEQHGIIKIQQGAVETCMYVSICYVHKHINMNVYTYTI
jgi:hypothetical protein